MKKEVVDDYFEKLKTTVEKLKVGPKQIWNCDETNMQLEHKPTAVVGRKGAKIPSRVANSKESVSVLGCGNASGDIMSPMIIVKGKTVRSLMGWKIEDAPSNTKWAYQEKSYMDTSLGVEWFEKVFLKECGVERPQLLILDSHCSHEPLDLLQCAKREQITLLTLPSHCTQELQPWDKSMFKPLKTNYNSLCTEFMSEGVQRTITKRTWPAIFCKAWESAITPVNMISGFAATGIWPFNPNEISQSAFAPNTNVQGPPNDSEISNSNPQSPNVSVQEAANDSGMSNVSPHTPNISVQEVVNDSELAIYSPQISNLDSTQMTVIADVHVMPSQSDQVQMEVDENLSGTVLEFPIMNEEGQQIITLPVCFDNVNTGENSVLSDLSSAQMEEVLLPSPAWNAVCESIFLPDMRISPSTKKKRESSATLSRILTSSDIINEKKEKKETKIQKAKAAEKRKAKAEQRKIAKLQKVKKVKKEKMPKNT